MTRDEKKLGVLLQYYNGIINSSELEEIEKKLNCYDISFFSIDKTGQIINSFDDLEGTIKLIISNSLVQSFALGVSTNAIYDTVKNTIIYISKIITGRFITKLSVNKKIESRATLGITVPSKEGRQIEFKYEGNIGADELEKCIDKMFEFAKDTPQKVSNWSSEYAYYNLANNQWEFVNIEEVINKGRIKQK